MITLITDPVSYVTIDIVSDSGGTFNSVQQHMMLEG